MLWILFSEFLKPSTQKCKNNFQHWNDKVTQGCTAGGGISCLATGFRDTILSISVVGVDDTALASIYRLADHCHRMPTLAQPTGSHAIVFQQIL